MKDRERTKEQLIKELEKLWQTNEFLSLLLESMPFAVYTCEVGGDFGANYISKNITTLTGYKPEDFTSNSEFWIDNVHPDDRKRVNNELVILLAKGLIKYKYRWRVADGSYKWFYDIAKLMKSPSGETSYILGTWVDITEQKQAEEKLRENEERFHRLADASFEGIAITEMGNFLEANKTFADMFGYAPSDIIGKNVSEFVAPEYHDFVMQKILSGYEKPYEAVCVRKDGELFPVEVCGKAIHYKGRKARVTAIRDITERKKMEEELKGKVEELEKFYDIAIDRELRMKELKEEIKRLKSELSQYKK